MAAFGDVLLPILGALAGAASPAAARGLGAAADVSYATRRRREAEEEEAERKARSQKLGTTLASMIPPDYPNAAALTELVTLEPERFASAALAAARPQEEEDPLPTLDQARGIQLAPGESYSGRLQGGGSFSRRYMEPEVPPALDPTHTPSYTYEDAIKYLASSGLPEQYLADLKETARINPSAVPGAAMSLRRSFDAADRSAAKTEATDARRRLEEAQSILQRQVGALQKEHTTLEKAAATARAGVNFPLAVEPGKDVDDYTQSKLQAWKEVERKRLAAGKALQAAQQQLAAVNRQLTGGQAAQPQGPAPAAGGGAQKERIQFVRDPKTGLLVRAGG